MIVCAKNTSSFLKIVKVPRSNFASSIIWLIERCFERRSFYGLMPINEVSLFSTKLLFVLLPFYLASALLRQLIGGSSGLFFLYLLFYLIGRVLIFDSLNTAYFSLRLGVDGVNCPDSVCYLPC
jgi:hypothetical protein